MQAISDEEMQTATEVIEAEQKRAKVSGISAEIQRNDLLQRLSRCIDGSIGLTLNHPDYTGEGRPIALLPNHDPWLETHPVVHPLADGLRLFFSDKSPDLEMSRRHHTVAEQARKTAVEAEAYTRQLAAQRAEAAAENTRRRAAWSGLSDEQRALAKLVRSTGDTSDMPSGWAPIK